jgi:hypothetical protein
MYPRGVIHASLFLAKTSFSLRGSANVVIADLNEEKGSKLVEEVRNESKNPKYVPFWRSGMVGTEGLTGI